jgi:hypothetical protein
MVSGAQSCMQTPSRLTCQRATAPARLAASAAVGRRDAAPAPLRAALVAGASRVQRGATGTARRGDGGGSTCNDRQKALLSQAASATVRDGQPADGRAGECCSCELHSCGFRLSSPMVREAARRRAARACIVAGTFEGLVRGPSSGVAVVWILSCSWLARPEPAARANL